MLAEIEALGEIHDTHIVSAKHAQNVAETIEQAGVFLRERRGGGFAEKDIQAAERYIDQLISGDVASDAKKELRTIAAEARAAQKDAALREIFQSKVKAVLYELEADKDHFESKLKPSDNTNHMNGTGLVDADKELTAAKSYVRAREILLNVIGAAERLLSDKKLDLSPITVGMALEDTRQEIAQRNANATGLTVSYETAVHDHAASIVQNIARETRVQVKAMKLVA